VLESACTRRQTMASSSSVGQKGFSRECFVLGAAGAQEARDDDERIP
jgi:hypothetical protein